VHHFLVGIFKFLGCNKPHWREVPIVEALVASIAGKSVTLQDCHVAHLPSVAAREVERPTSFWNSPSKVKGQPASPREQQFLHGGLQGTDQARHQLVGEGCDLQPAPLA
jgi:hypothetical protein